MWLSRLKTSTQNLLSLLWLLMLMLRNLFTTVWCRFGSWGLVNKSIFVFRLWAEGLIKILKLNFRQDLRAGLWLIFCRWFFVEVIWSWIMVKILKLALVNIWSLSLVQMLMFDWDFEVGAWSRFWRWNLIKIWIRTTQPSGPLCLLQCFAKSTCNIHCQRNEKNVGPKLSLALTGKNDQIRRNFFLPFKKFKHLVQNEQCSPQHSAVAQKTLPYICGHHHQWWSSRWATI